MGIKNYIQPVLALRVAEAGVSTSPITINDDVWIGANAVIAAGVTIGKHFVIGRYVHCHSYLHAQQAIIPGFKRSALFCLFHGRESVPQQRSFQEIYTYFPWINMKIINSKQYQRNN